MHDEGRVAGQRFIAAARLIPFGVGTFAAREVGDVIACPLPFRFVPPDEFLSLAPRRSVRRGGGAVVENAAIERPRVAPSVRVFAVRLALERLVLAVVNARVNPASARRGAVVFQLAEMFDRAVARAAVNLAQDLVRI